MFKLTYFVSFINMYVALNVMNGRNEVNTYLYVIKWFINKIYRTEQSVLQ